MLRCMEVITVWVTYDGSLLVILAHFLLRFLKGIFVENPLQNQNEVAHLSQRKNSENN